MAKKKREGRAPYRHRFTFGGRQYSVSAWTQAELISKVAARKKELEMGQRQRRDLSVAAWRDEWLETYKRGKVSDSAYSSYKSVLSHLALTMPVREVEPMHLQRILNTLEGRSDSLIHKFVVLTKELFECAVDKGLCTSNPARRLVKPKGITRSRRPLTIDERRLIEKVAPLSDAGPYVALMLYAGLRPGEAGIVQGRDVDLAAGMLHVRGTKTKAADRYVPISEKLRPYVEDLAPDQFAVTNTSGDPTTKDSRQGIWRRFMRELNIEAGARMGRPHQHSPHDLPMENLLADDLQPYLLRHTFCTDLEAAGVPINVARDLMGHSSIAITSKIYTHRTDKALQDAAAKMNRYQGEAARPLRLVK